MSDAKRPLNTIGIARILERKVENMLKEILFVLVVLFANSIEAITGFAGTLLAMPPSIRLIGLVEAKNVLLIIALLLSTNIMLKNRKNINIKEFGKITIWMFIGTIIGLIIYSNLKADSLIIIYSILLILIAIKGLLVHKKFNLPSYVLIVILLCAGIIQGMFLSGGSLLVIYALYVLKDKSVIRATLAPVWIALNIFLLIQAIWNGSFTLYSLLLSAICIIPVFIALHIGNILHDKVNSNTFERLTYILILISGISLLF